MCWWPLLLLQPPPLLLLLRPSVVLHVCLPVYLPAHRGSEDAAPARVMVFAGSEAQARQLSDPMRTVLWGDHKISGEW